MATRPARAHERTVPLSAELPDLSAPLTIAGRLFRPATKTTFRRDLFVMATTKAAGVEAATAGFAVGDDLSKLAESIIVTAFQSGSLFLLLAALLDEDDVEWTEATAHATAQFFADLSDEDDKRALHSSIVGVLMGFFVSGVGSLATSPTSSDVAVTPRRSPRSSGAADPSRPTPTSTRGPGDVSTSGHGAPSSARSPASTSAATPSSSSGRSGKGS